MTELEQFQQELSEIDSFIPNATGGNLVLLTDRRAQLTGKISELSLNEGMANNSGPDTVEPAEPITESNPESAEPTE